MLAAAGLVMIALAAWGLWRDVAWLAQPFYVWVWWGYILVLDGFCAWRRGSSLLTTRRRLVPSLCVASVSFWFFFELLNLRFQNWYYVGVFAADDVPSLFGGVAFVVAAFSTVFMGIFETIEALSVAGLFRRWRGRASRPLAPWVSWAVQALGAAMAFCAIAFPYYLAPLIWGSFTFLVDPWNYRRGARSILRDIEVRDWGLVARVFVAGLVCGVVWESMNFFAPQKWIYTVRGLEGLKLFEMPLLGFLGFPGLAYDSLAGYALFSWWCRGNRPWEHPDDLGYALRTKSRERMRLFWWSVPAQGLAWALIGFAAMNVNIASLELTLDDLVLTRTETQAFRAAGIDRPRQLLRRAHEAGLAGRLGVDDERLRAIVTRAELLAFKGIGRWHGDLLAHVGVHSVADLREWSTDALRARLDAVAADVGVVPPRRDIVHVWILASRSPHALLLAENP